jgi:hypothetical protein
MPMTSGGLGEASSTVLRAVVKVKHGGCLSRCYCGLFVGYPRFESSTHPKGFELDSPGIADELDCGRRR